jgi:hypothetical protein
VWNKAVELGICGVAGLLFLLCNDIFSSATDMYRLFKYMGYQWWFIRYFCDVATPCSAVNLSHNLLLSFFIHIIIEGIET